MSKILNSKKKLPNSVLKISYTRYIKHDIEVGQSQLYTPRRVKDKNDNKKKTCKNSTTLRYIKF